MYDSPILALLCDGRNLQFFELSKHNEETKFRLGKFPKGETRLVIPDISPRDAVEDFDAGKTIRQLRSICEALYYTFLKGYCIGLEGFWDRSVKQAAAEKKLRESTPRWRNSL